MPTIVSVGSITIVDVNDGAPGPAVVVTGNRPLNFTATDGVLDSAQSNIVLTAEVFGLASAAYVWTFLGFETSPVSSGTSVQTITMAQFGTSRAASVTCTVNGLYASQVTIVRAERSTAEAGATVGADWNSNLANRPSNAQLLNNLLDTSTWTGPSHGGVPGFNPNGSDWEQYRRHRVLPDGSQGLSWYCFPGLYHNNAYGWDNPQPGSSPAGDADGGWNTDLFPITSSRGYRFSVWICHTGGDTGTAYLGCGGGSVRDMGGGAVNPNPYFVVHGISGLVVDRWYLFVGYVHPEGRSWEGQTSLSGIYDGTTGAKVASGTDYCWAAGATTSIHRAYLYYAAPGSHLDFVWPRVDMLNGMEPSLAQLLAMGSVSARNPITSSNVTTYIANAAIGNAQIGGDIYSDLWNSSGNTQGWYLQRNGNLYCANAYVRGNVEASSLKANTAMVNRANIVNAAVDTLQIEGNAVTVPVSASGTSSATTASSDFESSPVTLTVTCNATVTATGIGSRNVIVTATVKRNTTTLKTFNIIDTNWGGSSEGDNFTTYGIGAWVIRDLPGAGSHSYSVTLTGVGFTTWNAQETAILALGVKR